MYLMILKGEQLFNNFNCGLFTDSIFSISGAIIRECSSINAVRFEDSTHQLLHVATSSFDSIYLLPKGLLTAAQQVVTLLGKYVKPDHDKRLFHWDTFQLEFKDTNQFFAVPPEMSDAAHMAIIHNRALITNVKDAAVPSVQFQEVTKWLGHVFRNVIGTNTQEWDREFTAVFTNMKTAQASGFMSLSSPDGGKSLSCEYRLVHAYPSDNPDFSNCLVVTIALEADIPQASWFDIIKTEARFICKVTASKF